MPSAGCALVFSLPARGAVLLRLCAGLCALFAALGASVVPASAQTVRAIEYDEEDGLPSVQISDVNQLADGRLILATRAGLVTFDGGRWELDMSLAGLLDSAVRIAVDKRGKLWVGSRTSIDPIAIRSGKTWRFIDPPQLSTTKAQIVTIFEFVPGPEGEMLIFGNALTIHALYPNGWRLVARQKPHGAHFRSIAYFDDSIIIATDQGLLTRGAGLPDAHHDNLLAAAGKDHLKIDALVRDDSDPSKLWIAGGTWIGQIQGSEFTLLCDEPTLIDSRMQHCLVPDGAGGVLLGDSTTLLHYASSTRSLTPILGPGIAAADQSATILFRDREDVFWAASQRGIKRIPSLRFANYTRAGGLLEDEVTAIIEAPPGRMVLAHPNGLSFVQDSGITTLPLPTDNLYMRRIASVVAGADGSLWVTRDNVGVCRIAPDHSMEHFSIPGGHIATSLYFDNDGRLWLTHSGGLAVWDGEGFRPAQVELRSGHIRRGVLLSSGEHCLLTANNGMMLGGEGDWTSHIVRNSSRSNSTYDAIRDSRGRLLVATSDGILSLKDGRMIPFAPNVAALRGPAYGILEDDEHVLWFGTQDGVVRWDEHEAVRFSVAQGLAGHETNRAGLRQDSQGRLWIGTVGGASCYRPTSDLPSSTSPVLTILGLRAGREEFRFDEDLTLDSEDLEFRFRAVSFVDDARVRYRCRLVGYDEEWLDDRVLLAPGRVRYTSLPPGDYHFEVAASNMRGDKSPVLRSASVHIRAPIWQRWWFRGGAVALLMMLAWGVGSLVLERRRSLALDDQVRRRTAELRATERNYRETFERSYAPQLLIRVHSGVITAANQAALDLYGHPWKDLVGSSFAELEHPAALAARNDSPGTFREDEVILDAGRRYLQTHRTSTGDERHIEIFVSACEFDADLTVKATIHDVTGKKRLEEQLAAAQRIESIGMLAGGIAHDFNNILTTILGNAELLVQECDENTPSTSVMREGLDAIVDSGERAAGLTRQLLAFSRRQVVSFEVIDLGRIVGKMEGMIRRLIREDVELVLELEPNLSMTMGQPSQMEQVVLNLVANALDAMPDGGKLKIATTNVQFDEEYAKGHHEVKPGSYVRLSVSDTGIGMTKAVVDRIFEPFFTTKPLDRGTGLGLSTLHGIVKQASGHVTVITERRGRGTTFHIDLPKTDKALFVPVSPPSKPSHVHGAETILLCEDDESLRKLTTQILTNHGYKVLSANHPDRAIELAEDLEMKINLLVTDVIMPGRNGKELADALVVARPDMQILFVSGYSADVLTHQGILNPGIELLQKPFAALSLLQRVRELLDLAPASLRS